MGVEGEPWLSWLWIDTKSAEVAVNAVKVCKAAGVPIRNGAMGYNLPTFIRLKVASARHQDCFSRRSGRSHPGRKPETEEKKRQGIGYEEMMLLPNGRGSNSGFCMILCFGLVGGIAKTQIQCT